MKKNIAGKTAGIIIVVFVLVILAGVVFVTIGNPVSYFLAKYGAEDYAKEEFPDEDYKLMDFGFDFVGPYYYAYFENSEAADRNFFIHLDFLGRVTSSADKVLIDAHEKAMAIENEYDELFREVIADESFPIKNMGNASVLLNIAYSINEDVVAYLQENKLPDNKGDDLYNIAKENGCIFIDIDEKDVSLETAARILKSIDSFFKLKDFPYCEITLIILKEGSEHLDDDSLILLSVPKEVIKADDLSDNLEDYISD